MKELWGGLMLIAVWVGIQFGTQVQSGWIHVLLIAGVTLVIRGIVLQHPGHPVA